ncbi:TRAP transporter small permease [Falsihalocynthiibacter sp. SS001]|uniref:TRAP transporter small permease n=1 Tax=Falsihalocynthiibacter sp. SS001 TaxID=3349698 RepID=UPI0036D27F92
MDYRPFYPPALRWLSRLIDISLAVGGIAILVLVFGNAALRGGAGFDLAWSLEVTAFLLLWTTFLGCAAAVARGAHMRVTEVTEALMGQKTQDVLTLIINIAVAVLMLTLIWTGWSIAEHTWAQRTTVLYWPVGLLYASMPVGILLSLIFHLYNSLLIATGRAHSSEETPL